jgi:site-specific DNA recombinase
MQPMNRAVIYARVSTEDQVEKYGLATQLRACREYANGKLDVIAEITDDGVSGVILDRPGLDRVRRMVREGLVDVVLMLDADRLSRELAHLLILKPEIERKARLEFVTAKFEDSPSGRMFFGIRGVIAQYERELTRERTMRGKKERAREGLIVGGRVAYGYKYVNGVLSEDKDRAITVRQIFALYEAGRSIRWIASWLRDNGTQTFGRGEWGKSSIRRILGNETYAGVAHYGTHRREGKVLRLRDASERIAISVPALISREQWERVQARLSANPMVGRPSISFLLRGLLYCAKCGRRMCGESDSRDNSYRCTGRDRLRVAGEPCRNRGNARLIDSVVWNQLGQMFSSSNVLRAMIEKHESELKKTNPTQVVELRRRAAKMKRREEAALSAMLDPDFADAKDKLKREYMTAADERRRVELEISGLENAGRQSRSAGDWIDETVQKIRSLISEMNDPAMRQQVVRGVLNRADFSGDELRMAFVITPELATTF